MQVTAQMVKELRERTGAPMMDCKSALTETGGDAEKAVDLLRKKGLASAAKKAGRIASEGAVGSYIHGGGKLGVLVEVNCETDFVARTAEFQELIHDIAMHIAAADPRYASREEVPAAELERERAIYREQAEASGKPPAVIEKMIEGKLEKFFAETVLVEQAFVKNPDLTVGQLLAEKVAKIGENIRVRRFVRFKLGEGLEKRSQDFAQEVAQAAAGH
ncbi:MAG: translation elongation factor Ts [Acidobacteria bacterium]|jgi:elongation factor Ts|nr:translation elongation factor Ts [Thermoanaerobaculia bacterium]MDI9631604.1 translation elongation factor Ts [Acidobacteriota bacterium]OQC40544.1 MAG: Elongation factor Ts [Acidobacteria bacterium ADurb.Bin051]MBP7812294.1 translation elongation factor Ts [Thermoanaerobaculia bacterium]MBP8845542.1 translation elongation factor Ts [Thermoanaerobaculia bacterium]